MPATVTHAYFAKDVYDILPDIIKDKVDLNSYLVFFLVKRLEKKIFTFIPMIQELFL